MPINRGTGVEALLAACRRYFAKTGRRISYEYAMIDGVNDTDRHAALLAGPVGGDRCPCESHSSQLCGGEQLKAQSAMWPPFRGSWKSGVFPPPSAGGWAAISTPPAASCAGKPCKTGRNEESRRCERR